MKDQLQALEQVKSTAIQLGMNFGPKLFVAALILVAGYLAAQWAGRVSLRMVERFRLEPPVRVLLERAVRIAVFVLFAIMALQNLGIELLPLLAGLGIAGAGVALALQGVLGNVVAGLTIIFTRPYRIGDYLSIVKEEGEVLEISLFHTVLGHPDLSRVVIPNRKIAGEILHNYGRIRQLHLEVAISYDADAGAAIAAIREVLGANPRVLQDPRPLINVARLADSWIAIGVNPWVNVPEYVAAGGEIYEAILDAFRRRNIVIPVPQSEVRMIPARAQ